MKTQVLLAGVFTLQATIAAEVWWLEMDSTFHDALIKRFSEGDPVACRQLGDRLPALIKDGKIKELEWVDSDSKTGGRNFPAGEFEMKNPDGRTFQQKTGSVLEFSQKLDLFNFKIRTRGDGAGGTLAVYSHATFGTQWQPLFSIQTEDSARVLLGRDPKAVVDFSKAKSLFSVSAAIPEAITLTWVLGERHPALAGAGGGTFSARFEDWNGVFVGPSEDFRFSGMTCEWKGKASQKPTAYLENFEVGKGKSTVGKFYNAYGEIESLDQSVKIPIKTHVQKVDSEGMHSNEDKKVAGDAIFTMTHLP